MSSSRDQASQARTGMRVGGKYELRRVLGQGGMGTVYLAEHAFTGRSVAVKLLHAELAENASLAERFLREARAASAIHHPGIVEVLDAGQEPDGTLYLVLELLEGEDLAGAIDHHHVDALAVVRVARHLLDALAAAHARGIVHRDLKPENVYLCADGRVKLLDFGIAKQLSRGDDLRLTATGAVLGTPYYMSPEQARGMEVDARTDLWSLGAVLFHALAGRPPFEGQSYNALLAAILTEDPPRLATLRPDVPSALCAVVDRALARDRDARWQTAGEMAAAVDAVLAQGTAEVQLRTVALATTLAAGGESGVRSAAASSLESAPVAGALLSGLAMSNAPTLGSTPTPTPTPAEAARTPAPDAAATATAKKSLPWTGILLGGVAVVGVTVVAAILLSGALIGRAISGDGDSGSRGARHVAVAAPATPTGAGVSTPPMPTGADVPTPTMPTGADVPTPTMPTGADVPTPPTTTGADVPSTPQAPTGAHVPTAPTPTDASATTPASSGATGRRHARPHAPSGATTTPTTPTAPDGPTRHHAVDPVRDYEE